MMNKIQTEDPRSIRASRPEVPEELERAVMRCLVRKPAERFQTLGELVDAIAPFGPPRGQISVERVHAMMTRAGSTTGRPSTPKIDSAAVTLDADAFRRNMAHSTPAVWAQTSAKRGRRGAMFWVGGLGGLSLVLVLGFAIGNRSDRGSKRDPSPSAAAAPSSPSAVAIEPKLPAPAVTAVSAPAPSPAAAEPPSAGDASEVPTSSAKSEPKSIRAPRAAASAHASKPPSSAAPAATPSPNLFDEQK
jgi:serine/threonine-protein kinase